MNAAASFRRAFLLLACTLAALAVGQLAAATSLARAPRFVVELRISHASESLGGSARSRSIPRSNAAGNASASTTTATAVAVVESRVYDRTTELSGRITIDARSSSAAEDTGPIMTPWGWTGSASYRAAVSEVGGGGTLETVGGTIPSQAEAERLIEDSGGTVQRIEEGHQPPNPHQYPHINYTTASGLRGTVQISP